jgi:hypothetical protein
MPVPIATVLDSDLRALYSWMVRYTGALKGVGDPEAEA